MVGNPPAPLFCACTKQLPRGLEVVETLFSDTTILALAWHFTERLEFIERAASNIRAWAGLNKVALWGACLACALPSKNASSKLVHGADCVVSNRISTSVGSTKEH